MPTRPLYLPLLLAALCLTPALRAADDSKPPSAEEARKTVVKAMTALLTDNADDFESTLIRAAAFDAFGEVALPLDPFTLADDEALTPAINAVSWKPLYLRPGAARLSISLGGLLTFLFVKSGDDWKIDPVPTLKANRIDPMPDATLSVMRVKAKADLDFADNIKNKKYPTWRDARTARRAQNETP